MQCVRQMKRLTPPLRRRIGTIILKQWVLRTSNLPRLSRKRRRKKNKWEKICDNCEDKYLYDTYMKLEIKA